eukprot:COSAG01_NODE_1461_length_10242_cov_4.896283_2_plen_513_part_00
MLTSLMKNKVKKIIQKLIDDKKIIIEHPKHVSHGDYATPLCFQLAKTEKCNPKILAENYAKKLSCPDITVTAINGFLNFRFSDEYLWQYFQNESLTPIKKTIASHYLLEYVSANPTGPLHIGHARWAVIGSCIANLLRYCGDKVSQEFYINDAGQQIKKFETSIAAIKNKEAIPEDGYHGHYMHELAKDKIKNPLTNNIDSQKKDLKKINVNFDTWFSEKSLHEKNEIKPVIERLKQKKLCYEKEGALWFESTAKGDEKDRVLIKKDGQLTYFAVDIAYHDKKIKRGFNQLINIWGADHHGYIARVRAALSALHGKQYQESKHFQVILGQLVSLKRNGEPVRMSKRSGDIITLEEVIKEIGSDATRYFLAQNHHNTHLDFDLTLAKTQNSENPVYYVQYAYARIHQILKQNNQSEINTLTEINTLDEYERSLICHANQLKEYMQQASEQRNTQIICQYTYHLAKLFHAFYKNCPINKAKEQDKAKRIAIILKIKDSLKTCFDLLGISAPEKM